MIDRRSPRVEIRPLIYISRMADNSAFILNLSENGIGIQTEEVLQKGRHIPFQFPLPETEAEVRGTAEIVWSDVSGRAGLRFAELNDPDRFCVQQWINLHCQN